MEKTGDGGFADTVIDVHEFDSVSSACSLNLFVRQTDGAQSVKLTCDENLIEYFDIRVEGGKLCVDTKPGTSITTRTKSYVEVNTPKLSGVKASGSGHIEIQGSFRTEGDFNVQVSGSGRVRADDLVLND